VSGVRCQQALNLIPHTRHLTPILVRLDLFLKSSRICSRRTLAQKLCEAGRVTVNGGIAKSSHAVKVGDEITITRREKISKVRVLSLPNTRQTSRKDATSLYELLSEEPFADTV
jgi:ribosomal 50S subunit-recycling heat shock protein